LENSAIEAKERTLDPSSALFLGHVAVAVTLSFCSGWSESTGRILTTRRGPPFAVAGPVLVAETAQKWALPQGSALCGSNVHSARVWRFTTNCAFRNVNHHDSYHPRTTKRIIIAMSKTQKRGGLEIFLKTPKGVRTQKQSQSRKQKSQRQEQQPRRQRWVEVQKPNAKVLASQTVGPSYNRIASKMSQAVSKSGLKEAISNLALSYMIPTEHSVQRLPQDGEFSAVCKPYSQGILSFPSSPAYTSNYGAGTGLFAFSNDPLHSFMYMLPNASGAWSYQMEFLHPSGGNFTSVWVSDNGFVQVAQQDVLPVARLTPVSGAAVGLPSQYAWEVGGRSCFLSTVPTTLTVTLTAGPDLTDYFQQGFTATISVWKSGGWQDCGADTIAGATDHDLVLTLTVAEAGMSPAFVSVSTGYIGSPPSGGYNNILGVVSATGDIYVQQCIPGLWDKESIFGWMRMGGHGVFIHQIAAKMYAGGEFFGLQLPRGSDWYLETPTSIQTMAGAQSICIENGLYAFVKPDHDTAFQKSVPFDLGRGRLRAYRGSDPDKYNVLMVSFTFPLVSGAPVGTTFNVVNVFGLEFGTQNPMFELDRSVISTNDANAALDIVAATENVHENPLHMADITRALKWGLKHLGPPLLKFGLAKLATL